MTDHDLVFLLDVDNTLLDTDRVSLDLRCFLEREIGHEGQQRYWSLFKQLRDELGYADYLGALQRYRREYPHDLHSLTVSRFLLNYPFAECVFPGALAVVKHLKRRGEVVLLSDGDAVFQPYKIERAGLLDAVNGRVLIYVHKEQELDDIEGRYPARHYVLIDDKPRILAAVKNAWGSRVTTVFLQQGHYARAWSPRGGWPPPDGRFECISDLLRYDLDGPLNLSPALTLA
jgi:FMN phosphatase YigB (HAD superfamily)